MAERGDPQVLRLVVILLRSKTKMTQTNFGRKSGVDQTAVSDYEQGLVAPPEEALQRMARAAGVAWHLVVHLIRFLTAVLGAAGRRLGEPVDRALLETSLLAMMPLLIEEEAEPEPPAAEELLQEAREIWAALERYPLAERWQHIETAPLDACRSWTALAKVASEASAQAAAEGGKDALELAELSLLTAARG
ncbi:MAG: helix-turn-helix protein [Acidobacteriota bacterium]|jgi:transcriptional regulator with XRE-family HTH domain|nr:helix-turn-helix protein [Acidobacteriota bacterium]